MAQAANLGGRRDGANLKGKEEKAEPHSSTPTSELPGSYSVTFLTSEPCSKELKVPGSGARIPE